jgi:hypothetical protein
MKVFGFAAHVLKKIAVLEPLLVSKFRIIPSYGGSTPTHKQCPTCKEWVPIFMKVCICGVKDEN